MRAGKGLREQTLMFCACQPSAQHIHPALRAARSLVSAALTLSLFNGPQVEVLVGDHISS
jgi:hypothetical protein